MPVLARGDSRRLFVARAKAAVPEFEPDEHVDELCARLDDLPLAIELAAARTGLLTTAQLVERLGERLDLLRGGRDAEVRQRTLRATIEWSYELLNAEEQELLAALSVFQGGWTLESCGARLQADIEIARVARRQEPRSAHGVGSAVHARDDPRVRRGAAPAGAPQELLQRLLDALIDTFEAGNMRPESTGRPAMELAQAERPNVDVALEWARRKPGRRRRRFA